MVDTGTLNILKARPYEDLSSLKKWIRATPSYYDKNNFNELITNITMVSTAADEVEADDGITISYIGRSEVAIVCSGDADNASTNGKTYTLVYVDQDGTSHTATATGTATLNGTPVAFTPAIADFYAAVSFTASEADTNVNVYAMVAGSTVYATIATTATSATEANLHGIGSLYGRTHTNHNDGDGAVLYLEYLSGAASQGIKYGHCTINTTDGTTETRFYEGTYSSSDDTVTATTTTIKDFYRVRRLWSNKTPTANTHEFYIGDDDCANDGSGNDLYGVILEGYYEMHNTRYCTPYGYDAWVGKIDAWASYLAGDFYSVKVQYKAAGNSITATDVYEFAEELHVSKPIPLEELNDVIFSITDTDAAANITLETVIVEVKRY